MGPEEIDWIEADGNYAILHVGAQNHMLRETMATLEAQLPPNRFARVNRSAIVQLNRVKHVEAGSGRHFAVLKTGERVPLTRSVREFEAFLRDVS